MEGKKERERERERKGEKKKRTLSTALALMHENERSKPSLVKTEKTHKQFSFLNPIKTFERKKKGR